MTEKQSALSKTLWNYRHTGAKGTPIRMHRALRKLTLSPSILMAVILLPFLFDMILWINLDAITGAWADIFNFCIDKLHLAGQVSYAGVKLLRHKMLMPYPDLMAGPPLLMTVWGNGMMAALLLLLSNFMPTRTMPFAYLLRAGLLIQISSSLYFFFNPDHPPHDLVPYITGALTFGVYLLFFISPLLALVYYIFDIAFWRKCIITALILIYFIIALPFQYMLHAYIISSWSMIFMPVLYLLFGVLLDTLMFVCWYSGAMSWSGKKQGESFRAVAAS